MKIVSIAISLVFAMALHAEASERSLLGEDIAIEVADGVQISAYWQTVKKPKASILLFHMGGGSARGEYPNIAPKLNSYGFNTLAVDLRSGGDRLGAPNKTVAQLGLDVPYCDAYPDLAASLDWVQVNAPGIPVIAWGSSFSAALTVQLAAKRGADLAGALAFSPASGGPLVECRPSLYLNEIKIPLLALRPDNEMALESVQSQRKLFQEKGFEYSVIADGKHGSLMLDKAHTGKDMTQAWKQVRAFLYSLK